jgi:hypothetical protein
MGSKIQIYFKGIVFVPLIPAGVQDEEQAQLPWRPLSVQIGPEESGTSWSGDDVRGLAPDALSELRWLLKACGGLSENFDLLQYILCRVVLFSDVCYVYF